MLNGFFSLMVNLFLSIKRIISLKKRIVSLSILFFLLLISPNIKSQEILFGITGGLNMSTISAKEESGGFKAGINIGGLAQYKLNDKSSIVANLKFSTKGQQFSKIQENHNEHIKTYHSTSLYYIDVPILYQYHIKDLLGLEIGPTLNFCLGGKDKSKIGNESWKTKKFEKGSYNPLEFGLSCGVFSRDLGQSSFNNIFIEFRFFLGLTNFIKGYGKNTNTCAFLNIGYIIERPLNK